MSTTNTSLTQFEIPEGYSETYYKLLNLMVQLGLDIIKDCKAGCQCSNRKLVECWDMFQSACCAYNNGNITVANKIYNFVVNQLNLTFGSELPTIVLDYDIPTDEEVVAIVT